MACGKKCTRPARDPRVTQGNILVPLRGGVAPLPEVPHPAYQSWVASACGTSLVTSLWRSARTGDAQQFKKRERST